MDRHLEQLQVVAEWIGYTISDEQESLLRQYASWLVSEAIPAGGIGPQEGSRIWDRHICDSLAFAAVWPGQAPETCVDLGSGVGLPGLPLAILWPESSWVLVDRSGRRADLMGRAVRILGMNNVEIAQDDLHQHIGQYHAAFARAVVDPQELEVPLGRLVRPGGRIAIGITRTRAKRGGLPMGATTISIPQEVLDGGGEILIIDERDR